MESKNRKWHLIKKKVSIIVIRVSKLYEKTSLSTFFCWSLLLIIRNSKRKCEDHSHEQVSSSSSVCWHFLQKEKENDKIILIRTCSQEEKITTTTKNRRKRPPFAYQKKNYAKMRDFVVQNVVNNSNQLLMIMIFNSF